jgi:hypothetical protein
MRKSNKIGVAGRANAIEVPIVALKTIAGAVQQLHPILLIYKMGNIPCFHKLWLHPKAEK